VEWLKAEESWDAILSADEDKMVAVVVVVGREAEDTGS
jgi:hypothetical protein